MLAWMGRNPDRSLSFEAETSKEAKEVFSLESAFVKLTRLVGLLRRKQVVNSRLLRYTAAKRCKLNGLISVFKG